MLWLYPAILWINSILSNRIRNSPGQLSRPLTFSNLSNNVLLALSKALYTPATTATEVTATLNKELQLVSEWVARNKLVLNISKTKSILFGTNHSLNTKPQLNLVMDNVEIEQVEKTKLLGVTLDCNCHDKNILLQH